MRRPLRRRWRGATWHRAFFALVPTRSVGTRFRVSGGCRGCGGTSGSARRPRPPFPAPRRIHRGSAATPRHRSPPAARLSSPWRSGPRSNLDSTTKIHPWIIPQARFPPMIAQRTSPVVSSPSATLLLAQPRDPLAHGFQRLGVERLLDLAVLRDRAGVARLEQVV